MENKVLETFFPRRLPAEVHEYHLDLLDSVTLLSYWSTTKKIASKSCIYMKELISDF